MLNQTVLVGRLVKDPVIEEGKNYCELTIIVPRSFKNAEGIYEEDIIPITLYQTIAHNAVDYCKKGDLVGIKGRIQAKENEIEIVAEKLTFLSSKKVDEE